MRSELKAVDGISDIETDLDNQVCTFKLAPGLDPAELLDKLAEINDKMKDWSFIK